MSVEKVRAYLEPYGVADRIREFDVSSATVELAALAVGVEGARIAKTLSFKVDEEPILVVAAGDAKVDNSKYKHFFGAKAKMLTAEEAVERIGHAVGGVCPFALPDDVKTYLDVSLKRFETVFPAVGSDTARLVAAALGTFRGQTVIAPGNHDPYTTRSAYARTLWPDNVHIFTEDRMQTIPFPQYGCAVHGGAFTMPEEPADHVLAGFTAPDDGLVHIGLLHGELTGSESRYRPLTPEEIAATGLDYLALGHVHAPSAMNRAGNTVWAYPGCPQGRGFDELGERGFLFGDVEPGRVDMRFVPFAGRRYESLTVDVSGGDALDTIRRSLPPDTSRDIYRIRLTGETAEPLTLAPLERALSGEFFRLELRDDTRLRRDLWDRCGDDTLRGLFLGQLRREYDGADPRRQKEIEQAVRFGLAAMDNTIDS